MAIFWRIIAGMTDRFRHIDDKNVNYIELQHDLDLSLIWSHRIFLNDEDKSSFIFISWETMHTAVCRIEI